MAAKDYLKELGSFGSTPEPTATSSTAMKAATSMTPKGTSAPSAPSPPSARSPSPEQNWAGGSSQVGQAWGNYQKPQKAKPSPSAAKPSPKPAGGGGYGGSYGGGSRSYSGGGGASGGSGGYMSQIIQQQGGGGSSSPAPAGGAGGASTKPGGSQPAAAAGGKPGGGGPGGAGPAGGGIPSMENLMPGENIVADRQQFQQWQGQAMQEAQDVMMAIDSGQVPPEQMQQAQEYLDNLRNAMTQAQQQHYGGMAPGQGQPGAGPAFGGAGPGSVIPTDQTGQPGAPGQGMQQPGAPVQGPGVATPGLQPGGIQQQIGQQQGAITDNAYRPNQSVQYDSNKRPIENLSAQMGVPPKEAWAQVQKSAQQRGVPPMQALNEWVEAQQNPSQQPVGGGAVQVQNPGVATTPTGGAPSGGGGDDGGFVTPDMMNRFENNMKQVNPMGTGGGPIR